MIVMKHLIQTIITSVFLITRISMRMNEMFAVPNEKSTQPRNLRKGIIERNRMLLQNSGTRLGVE